MDDIERLTGLNVVQLTHEPSDAERAIKYREIVGRKLDEIAAVMTEARSHGIVVNFQISPPDAFGRHSIAMLEISKKLA